MCTANIISFAIKNITQELVCDKSILDVGAYNVNGSLRSVIEPFKPKSYIGVDIREGPDVDVVCDIYNLGSMFGAGSFDGVVCTEVLEHIKDWQTAIANLKLVIKPGGFLILSTPTIGFPFHQYPDDYWRFTLDDYKIIFCDFELIASRRHGDPGVCMIWRKPIDYKCVPIPILNIAEVKDV